MRGLTPLVAIKNKISKCIPWLLVATFAVLPFNSKLANNFGLLVMVLWLVEGGLKEKWKQVLRDPLAWIPLLYVVILCFGLLWTADLDWGLHIIKKSRRFLLIPVFISVMARHSWVVGRGRVLFVGATALTALVSLAVAFRWVAPFGHATLKDPSPFVYHTSYAPALAWAAYVAFALLLFDSKNSPSAGLRAGKHWKIAMGLAGGLIAAALFVNIGVAGYAAFFMLFGLLILQWRKNILWPTLTGLLLVGSVYFLSPTVHRRVNQNIHELTEYRERGSTSENKSTSIGPRLVFWENTWQVIKKHPVLGVGTGDFPAEYENVRRARTPHHWKNVDNPHNMYLMIWAQSGLVGLAVVLAFFVLLLRRAVWMQGLAGKEAVGLACFFLLIMMSDAYLTLSYTGLLFVLFAAMAGCRSRRRRVLLVHSQPIEHLGGAELSLRSHVASAPPGTQVDVILPDDPADLSEYDVVILSNLRPAGGQGEAAEYRWAQLWVDRLKGYRGYVIKQEHDAHPCTHRDARCINFDAIETQTCGCNSPIRGTFEKLYNLCDAIIFLSPLQRRVINHIINIKVRRQVDIATPVDFNTFRSITPFAERKHAALITGDALRVAPDAVALAEAEGYPVDEVDYLSVPYEKMPELLNQYQAVVVAPAMLHAFGRLVAEALACGCKVITNNRVGAMSYDDPVAACRNSNAAFWRIVARRPLWPNRQRMRKRNEAKSKN